MKVVFKTNIDNYKTNCRKLRLNTTKTILSTWTKRF